MLGPERPEAVSPERGVVLTDIHSHLLIVNKLLSLSLPLFSNLDDVLQVAENKIRDWLIGVQSPPAEAYGGRTVTHG